MATPTLSIAVIGKNEREQIKRWMHRPGEVPFLKEVVYVDTGSEDDSVAVAERKGATVHHFDWCDDFSAAKNFSIEQCSSEWVLQLDADEHLQEKYWPKVEALIQNPEAQYFNITIFNFEEDPRQVKHPLVKLGKAPRLFRQSCRYGFRYPMDGKIYPMLVHERLLGVPQEVPARWEPMDLGISHYGYLIERPEPNEMYRRLNLAQLELTPFSWRHWFFLSTYEFWYKRFRPALNMLNKALLYSFTFWSKEGLPLLMERKNMYHSTRTNYIQTKRQRAQQLQGTSYATYEPDLPISSA